VSIPFALDAAGSVTKTAEEIGLNQPIHFDYYPVSSALWFGFPALVGLFSIWWVITGPDPRTRAAGVIPVLFALGRLGLMFVALNREYDIVSAPDGTRYFEGEADPSGLFLVLHGIDWLHGVMVWIAFGILSRELREDTVVRGFLASLAGFFLSPVFILGGIIALGFLLPILGFFLLLTFFVFRELGTLMFVEACAILIVGLALWRHLEGRQRLQSRRTL
jgi:hypothetical protein